MEETKEGRRWLIPVTQLTLVHCPDNYHHRPATKQELEQSISIFKYDWKNLPFSQQTH